MADRKVNTGLSEASVREAFYRALHDLTDDEITAMIAAEQAEREQQAVLLANTIAALEANVSENYVDFSDFSALEARVAALEGGGNA